MWEKAYLDRCIFYCGLFVFTKKSILKNEEECILYRIITDYCHERVDLYCPCAPNEWNKNRNRKRHACSQQLPFIVVYMMSYYLAMFPKNVNKQFENMKEFSNIKYYTDTLPS